MKTETLPPSGHDTTTVTTDYTVNFQITRSYNYKVSATSEPKADAKATELHFIEEDPDHETIEWITTITPNQVSLDTVREDLNQMIKTFMFSGDDQDDQSGGCVTRVLHKEGDHLAQAVFELAVKLTP